MTKTSLILCVALFAVPFLPRLSFGAEQSPREKLNAIVHKCIDEQHRAPGMVAALITRHETNIVPVGIREDGKPEKVDADSIFEIGSITKVFTALILQDMADHGEVGLDDPVAKYLPASVKMPSRHDKQITLRLLATHLSGLPRLPDNLDSKDEPNPYADYTVNDMYEFLSNYKLPRDPGAKSEYSNFGMGLLGHALSLRAGTSYETLVTKRICDPLQLDSTRITLTPALMARLAHGHNESGLPVSNWDLPALAGCGGLRSSANDLLKLLSAEMGWTASPLSTAMSKTQEPQKGTGFLNKTALAWQIDKLGGIIWHNGGTGGYRSYIGFTKDKDLGVVVLANSANDVDDVGQYLLGDRGDIDDFKAPKKHVVAKIDPAIYDRYVGQYKFGPGVQFIFKRDGDKLMAQLTGQDFYEVFPESATEFFYKVVDAQLTFVTNDTGAATHVILHQFGLDQKATKIK